MKQAPDKVTLSLAVARSPAISVNHLRSLSAFAVTLAIAVAGFLLALDATAAPASAPSAQAGDAGQTTIAAASAEDSWVYMVDAPGVYLDRAHDELRRRQRTDAAASLRKAAAMI